MSSSVVEIPLRSKRSDSTFEQKLDELHELLFARGGIRPTNAAIEELAKLVLMQLQAFEQPEWVAPGTSRPIASVLDPEIPQPESWGTELKLVFKGCISQPRFSAKLPNGELQPIWPEDEPFRLDGNDVLRAALQVISVNEFQSIGSREDFDILGTAFDTFLRGRYDHAGGMGTYLTPHTVAENLARMCFGELTAFSRRSDNAPVMLDPCCGTGRFLIAALRECRSRTVRALGNPSSAPTHIADTADGVVIVGADQSPSAIAKARLNMLLFGVDQPSVFTVNDSLISSDIDAFLGKTDIILTNPPFGGGGYDHEVGLARTSSVFPSTMRRRKIDPALAFVARCLDLLADDGILGIVLPDGLVDGPTLKHALLSEQFLVRYRQVSIEASVSLPPSTFALAGTAARTSFLVLRKSGPPSTNVFFAKAEHVGFLKSGKLSVPNPEGDDLPVIAQRFTDIKASGVLTGKPLEAATILANRPSIALVPKDGIMSLDASRSDAKAIDARHRQRASGITLGELVAARPKEKRKIAAEKPPFVSVLHVDQLGFVDWAQAARYAPSTPGKIARSGDLIVSMLNPSKLRATVIPAIFDHVECSAEFGVLVPTVNPYVAQVLINHSDVRAQLSPLGRGTSNSRRRISMEDLLNLAVPPITSDIEHRAKILERANELALEANQLGFAALVGE